MDSQVENFKNELLQNPEIVSATITGYLPVTSLRTEDVVSPDGNYRDNGTVVQTWAVDYDYIRTMGMEVFEGSDFSKMYATDSAAVLINESAVKHFGWETPLSKYINDDGINHRVIGVVKDFHYQSMREFISPVALFLRPNTDFISLRLKTENLANTIGWIKQRWLSFTPGQPFEYSFLEDRFAKMYNNERKIGNIFALFSALAIFIGCLGLFGLAAYTAEQKTREIGIQKVLGASISGIVLLLTKEFAKRIIFAFIFACPISYIIMNNWLRDFAYRINIGWWVFILAGGIALFVALLTVSFQALKAALSNPTDSLKYE